MEIIDDPKQKAHIVSYEDSLPNLDNFLSLESSVGIQTYVYSELQHFGGTTDNST